MSSAKTMARLAGLLYLIVAIGGGFSELFVRMSVKVPGNAAATAANIVAHQTLFRLGFVMDLVDVTCFLGVGLLLYWVFKWINPQVALAMVVVNAVSVAMQSLNMLNHLAALLVATQPRLTGGLSGQTANSLTTFFLEMHHEGYLIAQIFFGLFLLPLGYLVYESGYLPRLIGIFLMIGSAGYVADLVAVYSSPGFDSSIGLVFASVGGLAEIVFLLWILVMGVNVPADEPRRPIGATARIS
jgi:Domain of unknown function (DUF4386)